MTTVPTFLDAESEFEARLSADSASLLEPALHRHLSVIYDFDLS